MKTDREWDIARLEVEAKNDNLIEKWLMEKAGNRYGNVQGAGRGYAERDSEAVRGVGVVNREGQPDRQPEPYPGGDDAQYAGQERSEPY